MMNDINLENYSLDELKSLERQVGQAIRSFEERRKREAIAAVEAVAREHGYALSELSGGSRSHKQQGSPKYRHPKNPDLTWTGRGRQPYWYREALLGGLEAEDLLIN